MKYWWSRYQTEGNIDVKSRPGARKALTEEQEMEIVRTVDENPSTTVISIAREYSVSDFTIRSLLKRHGLECRIAAKQSQLTEEHKLNRMAFCETLLEWNDEQLNSIIFSDEKSFCSDVKWQSLVYRPFNERYNPKYVKTERLSGRISACYWGAIGINGPVTDLVKINGRFNQFKYMEIIQNHVIPAMQPSEIFMQDNSPVHTAKLVMDLLSKQSFETMDWAPFSPDLNPIENVWSYMIRDWPLMPNRTDAALDELVQLRWNNLRNEQGYSKHLMENNSSLISDHIFFQVFSNIYMVLSGLDTKKFLPLMEIGVDINKSD